MLLDSRVVVGGQLTWHSVRKSSDGCVIMDKSEEWKRGPLNLTQQNTKDKEDEANKSRLFAGFGD